MEAIFSNPKYALKSSFIKEAKKQGFTNNQIQDFLSISEATQIHKQTKGRPDFYPIIREPYSFQLGKRP